MAWDGDSAGEALGLQTQGAGSRSSQPLLFPEMSQLSSDVPAVCVHLRLFRFIGLAALPLCKQLVLEYLQ